MNEPMTTIPKNFEKYAAVDIVYKTMACFGIAHSNSAGDRNRFNKNMLNLLKENKIPIVYMNSIDIFLPSNPPSEALCLSEGDVSSTNPPPPPQTCPLLQHHVASQKFQLLPNCPLPILSTTLLTSPRHPV